MRTFHHLLFPWVWLFFMIETFVFVRWALELSSNSSFYCYMWNHPLNFRWAAFVDFRSCRAHSYNVHLLVQFRQRKVRLGEGSISSLGWVVRESIPSFSTLFYVIKASWIRTYVCLFYLFMFFTGFASGQL